MGKPIVGTVSSDKNAKTIVVSVLTRKTHPIYKKQYSRNEKIMAHDENNEARVGDKVSIVQTRPISAKKRFKLHQVIEKATIHHKEDEEPKA